MHKKLVAIMTALCCITSMGASLNCVYAVGESDTSVSTQSEGLASSIHSLRFSIKGSVSNSDLSKMTFKIYNHYRILQQAIKLNDSARNTVIDINDEETLGRNGNLWYVEIEGLDSMPHISVPGVITGRLYQVPIDVSDSECSIQIEDKSVNPMTSSIKAVKPTIDTDLTDSQLKTIEFTAYNAFGFSISSFTGLDVKNGKAEITTKDGDIGESYIEVNNKDVIDKNGWYVPRVYWNAEDISGIKLTAKSTHSSDSVYEKPVKLNVSAGLTERQLSHTLFKVYDTKGNVCGTFTGLDVKQNTSYGNVFFTGKDCKETSNGGIRRIVCESYDEYDRYKVSCYEKQFYILPNTAKEPVVIDCFDKSSSSMAPALAAIKVSLTTNICNEDVKYLSYEVRDAFGRLVKTLKAADMIEGNAGIPYEADDIGNWTITSKVASGGGFSMPTPVHTFAIDKVTNSIHIKDMIDVYEFDVEYGTCSAYIMKIFELYKPAIEVFTNDGVSVFKMDMNEFIRNSSHIKTIIVPKYRLDKQTNKTLTFKLTNLPSFLASPPKSITMNASKTNSVSIEPWFDSDKNYYKKITVSTSGPHVIDIYRSEADYLMGMPKIDTVRACKFDMSDYSMFAATDVAVPIDRKTAIRDRNLGSVIEVDTIKNDSVSFVSPFSKYELKVEYKDTDGENSITLGKGDSFIKDACNNDWKSKTQFGDNIYNAVGGKINFVVTITDNNGNKIDYYWAPDDRKGEAGILVNKDYCDNYKWTKSYRAKLDDFLVGRKNIHDHPEDDPQRAVLFDRNHDGKLNVFDSILTRRECIKQNSTDSTNK